MTKKIAKIGLISISDRASSGQYEDKGIPSLLSWLEKVVISDFEHIETVIPDDKQLIEAKLIEFSDDKLCDLILTTGGTGPAPRDVTPEATLAVATKIMPGFGERMRQISALFVPTAILSRQEAVIRSSQNHSSLIVNLPGQPKAIAETLEGLPGQKVDGIFAAIPYCIELIGGPTIETDPLYIKSFRPSSAKRPEIINSITLEPPKGRATSSIIMLHGLGADASDFASFREELLSVGAPVQSTRFVLPHAPVRPITMNNGYPMRGWFDLFSLEDISEEDDVGIEQTWRIVRRLISEEQSRGIPRNRIFLGGFSQGGCMAMFSALKLSEPIGGIFSLSGYLPLINSHQVEHMGKGILTPIFVGYGLQDSVVLPIYTEMSIKELQKLGAVNLWSHGYPGMEHYLGQEETIDLAKFLTTCLAEVN